MAKAKQDADGKGRMARLRERYGWLDHVVRMHQHYSKARGNHLAGAITYFGFLSLFPIIAIAFAALSYVVAYYPDAQRQVEDWLTQNLPGLTGPGGLQVQEIAQGGTARVSAGIAGAAGLLYSGLGWLDAMREALRQMWAVEPGGGNFVVRKLVDFFVLVLLGGAVLMTTAVSSVTTALTGTVLEAMGLSESGVAALLLRLLALTLAVLANVVVLTILFSRLPGHRMPWKNMLTGALLGAVAIELLKLVGTRLIAGTTNNPVYGTFAIVVGLLVWINFISRAVMYAAAWCVVGPVPTVEEQMAAEGETLSQEEAEAASDARERDDDRPQPVGAKHTTTAGAVDFTTTGTGTTRRGGGGAPNGSSPGGAGGAGGKGRGPRRAQQQDGQVSGGVTSFAGVLALMALRRRRGEPASRR